MLKVATMQDLETIMDMALSFIEVTDFRDLATPEAVEEVVISILNAPKHEGIFILGEGAMLAGVVKPFLFNPQLRVATEVAWWVDPDKRKTGIGLELLNAYEYWAKEKAGCSLCMMVSLDNEVGKIYEKNGYRLTERAYTKVL